MNKAYIYLAKKLIELAIKELIASYPYLKFMSGFLGTLISIIVSPILARLMSNGILSVDFKFIDNMVEQDGVPFKDFFTELYSMDSTKITKEQEQELLNKAKALTRKYISIKHRLG